MTAQTVVVKSFISYFSAKTENDLQRSLLTLFHSLKGNEAKISKLKFSLLYKFRKPVSEESLLASFPGSSMLARYQCNQQWHCSQWSIWKCYHTCFRMHSLCLVGNYPVKISDWWSRSHENPNLAVFLEEKVCNQEPYFLLWLDWESTVLRCKTGVQEKHIEGGIITIISTSVSQFFGIQTHKCLSM